MTSSDSAWLSFWSGLAVVGCIVVVIGVVLEGAEYFVKWGKKKIFRKWIGVVFNENRRRWVVSSVKYIKPRILPIETVGFTMLVFGLAVELLGGFAAGRMQSKENSELETTNKLLSLQIEELHSNNLVLQLKLQPRTITVQQITNFISLTRTMVHFPIRVGIGPNSEEPFNYALQIRDMLNKANFTPPDSDTNSLNYFFGVGIDPTAITWTTDRNDTNWPDVCFASDDTNAVSLGKQGLTAVLKHFSGLQRPLTPYENSEMEFEVIPFVFRQIGIQGFYLYKPDWVGTNHFEIFVRQKSQ